MGASIGPPSHRGPVYTRRIKLTFPEALIQEPIIHTIGKRFDLVTNVRRAEIREDTGWVVLELTGREQRLDEALAHLEGIGVRIDDVEAYLE